MKVLVSVVNYPNDDGGVALMYVHVRNLYYIEHGIDVTVLNFSAEKDYIVDGVPVITKSTYEKENSDYDLLVCHAPNIRHHYKFLKSYESRFNKLLFFFHGHEVVKLNKAYPKPYSFVKQNKVKAVLQNLYDCYKLKKWHKYLPKLAYKSKFVFVSNTFCEEALNYLKLKKADLLDNVLVINNSVGKVFEERSYDINKEKIYDFITIRSYMDSSTYCVDLVKALAERYPDKKFLFIGKGKYFDFYSKPDNITFINGYLRHGEMLDYIDQSKTALILTRRDTQGVMTCELATYGIPVITSDIPVCKEIFGGLDNVKTLSNSLEFDLVKESEELISKLPYSKTDRYGYKNTILKEEKLITALSSANKKVAIVMLNYNGSGDTIECLKSLNVNKNDYKVFLLDNGSKKESVADIENYLNESGDYKFKSLSLEEFAKDELKDFEKELYFVKSTENLGFALGNNKIASVVAGSFDYLLLLNNDTEVSSNAVSSMVKTATKHSCPMLTCDIRNYYDKSKLWNAGGVFKWYGDRKYYSQKKIDRLISKGVAVIDAPFITGCAMLVECDYIRKYGLFTERFFFGEEDFNFCKKALLRGYLPKVDLSVKIFHKVGQSMKADEDFDKKLRKSIVHYTNRVINLKSFYSPLKFRFWRRFYLMLITIKGLLRGEKRADLKLMRKKVISFSNAYNGVSKELFLSIMNDQNILSCKGK